MKINEVEAIVGVTRRNIRFYEKEGLLTPARNHQNGYRDYTDAEVEELERIKLLRKLGVPLDEIRRMQQGNVTVSDAMRRHVITLEREQEGLVQSMALCSRLKEEEIRLCDLDAKIWLEEMRNMESKGVTFRDKQLGDVKRKRYVATALAATVMIVLMAGLIALMLWAFSTDPVGAPPMPLLVILLAIPAAMIVGTLLALAQRWREIKGGEEDEARKY